MLEQYIQKPHPLKSVLMKDYNLPLSLIANFMGISYTHCSNVLAGKYKKENYDAKLNKLLDLAKKDRSYKCDPDTGGNLTSC